MPFPHIVKVFNPLRLIQKLRNVIDELLVENRKLADENCQLKLQILDLSNKLSSEIEGRSRDIDHLESLLEERDQYINDLSSENQEYEQLNNDLEWKLKKCDQSINDQENKIASMEKLIRDIHDTLQDSGIDF